MKLDTALGLANVEVSDDGRYILVDKLTPRAFAETADMDLEQCGCCTSFMPET